MSRKHRLGFGWSVSSVLLVLQLATAGAADEPPRPLFAPAPGDPRTYVTIHSIGIEWDIAGDANHNATCSVEYRAQQAESWQPALPLMRVDYHGWYIADNVIAGRSGVDPTVNDLSGEGVELSQSSGHTVCRNNLYILAGGRSAGDPGHVWVAYNHRNENPEFVRFLRREDYAPNWMTDVDYDGFDWGASRQPFRWGGRWFEDLADFSAAIGIEQHGVRVAKDEIFEIWNLPAAPGRVEPVTLNLKSASNCVDAGAMLPNVHHDFAGDAPDLGAAELGRPLPAFGPRAR